jgi:hypothetical protein
MARPQAPGYDVWSLAGCAVNLIAGLALLECVVAFLVLVL